MLRIYYADISALPAESGDLPLSAYRLAQLSSCRLPLRRRQGLGAELLLIHALREEMGNCLLPLSIERTPDGKPFLPGSPIRFSLSHSGETVACAISDAPVGLDLEAEQPLKEALLHRFFSEQEQRLVLGSACPASAFTELWTKKESYLKATGEGLRALSGIDLLSPPENAFFHHWQLGTLHLSVCVLGCPAVPYRIKEIELSRAFLKNLLQD